MVATGTPLKLQLLNNIQGVDEDGVPLATKTGLALINTTAGSGSDGDYFTDVQKIQRIDAGPMDLKEFPAIVIAPAGTDYARLSSQGTTTIAATFIVQVSLILRTRTEAAKKIEDFIRDAHRALTEDRQRDGNATSTRLASDEVFYPNEDDEPYTTANLVFEIDYRTPWNDLDIAT